MNQKTLLKNRPHWVICILTALIAMGDALISTLLVYQNDFAPDGVQGIATLLQEATGLSVGLYMGLINAPLLLFAFFRLSRSYAVKNLVYVISFSLFSVVLRFLIADCGLSFLEYKTEATEMIFAVAICYGLFNGVAYALTVMMGGSTGGTDVLAQIINYFKPAFNTVWILFFIKVGISVASFFVYGRRALPVLVSIVCALTCSVVSDTIFKGQATALKFEIVTENPAALAKELMEKLGHGCTMLNGTGMYEQKEKALLICVVSRRNRQEVENILKKYPDTFAYCCPVKATYGKFEF